MSHGFRILLLAFAMALAAAGAPTHAIAALECYPLIPVEMVTTVNSAQGFSGQVFQFKTTQTVSSNGSTFPAGTQGYGVVLNAIPARNRSRNGGGIVASEAVNGTNISVGPGYTFHVVPIGNLQERGPCIAAAT